MDNLIKELYDLYGLFDDDLSKDTFLVRLQYDIEGYNERMRKKLESVYDEIAWNEVRCVYPIEDYRQYEYFRFRDRFRTNTAMIDCGCFDGRESIYFSKWINGQYSKIYAFEPNEDSANYSRTVLKELNAEVFQVALSDKNSVGTFYVENQWKSYLTNDEYDFGRNVPKIYERKETIVLKKLDDLVNEKVGFIKLQAMGGEYNALKGASRIIKECKPILSIVNDRYDQLIAIMYFIHDLSEKYRFHYRQYYDIAKDKPGRCILIGYCTD